MGQMLDARELDLLFAGENILLPTHPRALALRDDFVCVGWNGNKRVRNRLTIEQYLALGHAITRYGLERRPGFEQYTLERLGVQRKVVVSCTTPACSARWLSAPSGSRRCRRAWRSNRRSCWPLKLFEPPLELPPLQIYMQWHRNRERDGATAWLRELMAEVSRRLGLLE